MISVLISIGDLFKMGGEYRIQLLNTTLNNLHPGFNVVIMDTGIDSSKQYIKTTNKYKYIYNKGIYEFFNQGATINEGLHYIEDDLFILLDAKVLLPFSLYKKIIDLNVRDQIFMGVIKNYCLLEPYNIINYEDTLLNIDNIKHKEKIYYPGRVLISNKRTFREIGGAPNTYIGPGPEDKDMMIRYMDKFFGKEIIGIDVWGIHMYHDNRRYVENLELHKRNECMCEETFNSFAQRHNITNTKFKYYKDTLIKEIK